MASCSHATEMLLGDGIPLEGCCEGFGKVLRAAQSSKEKKDRNRKKKKKMEYDYN
jgi:hypothetical protein